MYVNSILGEEGELIYVLYLMDLICKEKGNFMYNRDVYDFFFFEVGV